MYIESRNAEGGTRNSTAAHVAYGFCIHHSPVIRSSNSTALPPPSNTTSTHLREIGCRHHSSSMRQTSPTASTGRRISHPASRILIGCPFASSSTATRWGAFRDRSLSALLRVPPSAFRVCSRFIVDQRIPPLRKPRPRLHLDDVIEQRALEPELDLLSGAAERATPPGARRGLRVAREQLQLRGAGDERGELDDQSLHRAGGGRPLELRLEWRRDALPVRGRVLERRLHQPRRAVLELGARPHDLHPPPAAARIA